ncbi:transcriptional regulator with GAF, ATPase, and Fis domain [Bacillus mesophilus]|uniref:GAF domain-containing protein n=1 Tax=Bacillus mesophilus TaxID=1808955 RepID=A0A6M0QDS8_9BACI|nr:GAF domain-containing protein [Bacillus mesophilus]MBM7660105.1 transcriptional regulator with GAF, ATPase, and Fis domain [Bacillus mesophilus]NEY73760.1 GAF domain-containing protein [Bacillus mesophilus]
MTESYVNKQLTNACQEIYQALHVDFTGIACYEGTNKEFRWKYVAGNRSSKWKRMTIRFGKGMAGKVYQTGSRVVYDSSIDEAIDFPIVLAEKLERAIAFPIFLKQDVWGVLLLGFRKPYDLSKLNQEAIVDYIKKLELIVINHSEHGGEQHGKKV